MDDADRAQIELERQEEWLRQKVDAARGCADYMAGQCDECGAEIPEARKAIMLGCKYCVQCADRREHEARLYV